MAKWWSIEVFDSRLQAAMRWADSCRSALVESALTSEEERRLDLTAAERSLEPVDL